MCRQLLIGNCFFVEKYLARNRGGCKFFSDFDIKAVLKRRKARRDMDSAVSWRLSGGKLPEKKRTLPDDLRLSI